MTLVRTRLLIEGMAPGDTAEIRLTGGEPLANIPRALIRQGHILLESRIEAHTEPPVHRLVVRKKPD